MQNNLQHQIISFIKYNSPNTDLLEEIDSNWKHLANFESAFNRIPTEETSIYSDIADNQDAPSTLRELAQYLEVMNLLHQGKKIDEDKINNLVSNTVYPYSSQEAIAVIKIQNNDVKV
ncbi:MAG: hypothetical protein ACR5KV_00175 [Wolbachia sp.]